MRFENVAVVRRKFEQAQAEAKAGFVLVTKIENAVQITDGVAVDNPRGLAAIETHVARVESCAADIRTANDSTDIIGNNLLPLATVPLIDGLTKDAAIAALAAAGITDFSFEETPSRTVDIGIVFSQSFPQGTVIESDRIIGFLVSLGDV